MTVSKQMKQKLMGFKGERNNSIVTVTPLSATDKRAR